MANNYNYSNNNNSNNYNYSNNNNSNNYNHSNNNNNLGNNTKGIKFDFVIADSNNHRHNITGFAYPEDKRVKTKITIDNTIVIRGCSIRFAKNDGHPFLTYPTFKNKKNEFVDLLFISDTTMSQAIVSGILGVC